MGPMIMILAALMTTPSAHAGPAPGQTVQLDDLLAEEGMPQAPVLVVNLWASWCGPCRNELPMLDALEARLPDEQARVVALNIDRSSRRGEAIVRHLGLTLPIVYDATATHAEGFDPGALPATYVVRRDGTVLGAIEGELDVAAIEQLEQQIHEWSRPDPAPSQVAGVR